MKSLKELAKELGVSTTVVSYVYHNKWRENRVGEALAAKVKEALEREGCKPSRIGLQLKTGRSMTVGVLLPDFGMPHWLDVLKGVDSVMTPSGFLMLLAGTNLGSSEGEALSSVLSRGVDGIIMSPYHSKELIEKERASFKRQPPIVFVDTFIKDMDTDYVVCDNRKGASELVKALFAAGRKRIAYIGTSAPLTATEDRFQGYLDALKLYGVSASEELIHRASRGEHGLPDSMAKLLDSAKPDAIFVEGLSYFGKGLEMIAARGLKVPQDIMLAGFDDIDSGLADKSCIDPSSIVRAEQNMETIGRLAASRLKELINSPGAPRTQRMELVVDPKFFISR